MTFRFCPKLIKVPIFIEKVISIYDTKKILSFTRWITSGVWSTEMQALLNVVQVERHFRQGKQVICTSGTNCLAKTNVVHVEQNSRKRNKNVYISKKPCNFLNGSVEQKALYICTTEIFMHFKYSCISSGTKIHSGE